MSRKKVFILCFIIVILTLLFNANTIVKKQIDVSGIEITTKLISVDVKEGSDITVDVELSNNSGKTIYNVELLTEAPNKDYTQAYGNVTCKTTEEVLSGDSLYLRSVYEVQDDDIESFEGYKVQHRNILLMIECLIFYIIYVIALLKFTSKESKLNIVYLLLVMLCSFGVSILIKEISISGKDESIIYSYEDLVEVEIEGKKQYVKVLVNYTTDSLESIIDKNNNGMPDVAERGDFKRDTDGDGLSDFYELYMCGTNPLMVDSQSTGLGDINCDTDRDGLSNLEEYELNCNPLNKDTDYDGLNDSEELELGTKVLEWDTDGDGMSDGFEIEQGYDPLVKDEKVVVNKELSSEDKNSRYNIKARVEVKTTGDVAESLDISTYETMLVNDNMPGYIGSAFEFTMDDSFESATISFELDDYWFNKKDCEPCIYYFNEETQLLEELETHIEGNIVSANVEHFSVYVVLNRLEVSEWMYKDIFYQDLSEGVETVNVGFVVDISSSMRELDANNVTNKVINNFVRNLSSTKNISCNVSLTTFTKEGTLLCDFTDEYSKFLAVLDTIERDTGYNENSGTDIQAGILSNLQCFFGLPLKRTYDIILLVTDGDLEREQVNEDMLLAELKKYSVRLYCIDIGSTIDNSLKRLAIKSGGRYYIQDDMKYAVIENILQELDRDVTGAVEGYTYGDLSNEDLKLLESDELRTGTGIKIFEDVDLSCLSKDEDFDEDGLSNGEELQIRTSENGHTYYYLRSNPFLKDTDDDGIDDSEDTAPFVYGLEGGVVGEVSIVSHPGDLKFINFKVFDKQPIFWFNEDVTVQDVGSSKFETGHTWITFHSYVDYIFEINNIKAGYIPIHIDGKLSYIWRHNLYPYKIAADSYMSFGHYPSSGIKGVYWEDKITNAEIAIKVAESLKTGNINILDGSNNEKFKVNREFYNLNNVKSENIYNGANAYTIKITGKDLSRFLFYVDSLGDDFNYFMPTYNCTDFAVESWNYMVDKDDRIKYSTFATSVPIYVWKELQSKKNSIQDFDVIMKGWLKDIKPFFRMDSDGNILEEKDE